MGNVSLGRITSGCGRLDAIPEAHLGMTQFRMRKKCGRVKEINMLESTPRRKLHGHGLNALCYEIASSLFQKENHVMSDLVFHCFC